MTLKEPESNFSGFYLAKYSAFGLGEVRADLSPVLLCKTAPPLQGEGNDEDYQLWAWDAQTFKLHKPAFSR